MSSPLSKPPIPREDLSPGATASNEQRTASSNLPATPESQPTGAGVDTGAGTTRAKTEAEEEADRLYEEAIEEEYAKREGGA